MYDAYMEAKGTAALVRFRGEIDIADQEWLTQLARSTEASDTIIVDVHGLRYADTTFLRFLLTLKRSPSRRAADAVRLVRAGKHVKRVLQVTGMTSLFAYYDALGDATREFSVVRAMHVAAGPLGAVPQLTVNY